MLRRQNLGRSHHGRLIAVLNHVVGEECADQRLTAADIALYQAVHQPSAGQIGQALGDHAFLRVGEREREEPSQRSVVERAIVLAGEFGAAVFEHRESGGEQKQLLKHDFAPCACQSFVGSGKMQFGQGRTCVGEIMCDENFGRKDLGHIVTAGIQRGAHGGSHLLARKAGRQRIDRQDRTLRRFVTDERFHFRRDHGKPIIVLGHAAVKLISLPNVDLIFQIGEIKIRNAHTAGFVDCAELKDCAPVC